jgi:hypothetical protein
MAQAKWTRMAGITRKWFERQLIDWNRLFQVSSFQRKLETSLQPARRLEAGFQLSPE